jgi:hypothetical protein
MPSLSKFQIQTNQSNINIPFKNKSTFSFVIQAKRDFVDMISRLQKMAFLWARNVTWNDKHSDGQTLTLFSISLGLNLFFIVTKCTGNCRLRMSSKWKSLFLCALISSTRLHARRGFVDLQQTGKSQSSNFQCSHQRRDCPTICHVFVGSFSTEKSSSSTVGNFFRTSLESSQHSCGIFRSDDFGEKRNLEEKLPSRNCSDVHQK